MSLSEIMHKPTFVDKNASVSDAAKIMAKKSIGSVLVGTADKVLGIFSERDMITKIAARDVNCRKAIVKDYMTHPVKTIGIDSSIFDAQEIMTKSHIRRLPVTNSGRVVGIVSARNLMEHLKYEYLKRSHGISEREKYPGYW